nr:MAG TPA: apelin receptor protein [Caudoviricetes sp.]
MFYDVSFFVISVYGIAFILGLLACSDSLFRSFSF